MQCAHIPTELPFCIPPLVVGHIFFELALFLIFARMATQNSRKWVHCLAIFRLLPTWQPCSQPAPAAVMTFSSCSIPSFSSASECPFPSLPSNAFSGKKSFSPMKKDRSHPTNPFPSPPTSLWQGFSFFFHSFLVGGEGGRGRKGMDVI